MNVRLLARFVTAIVVALTLAAIASTTTVSAANYAYDAPLVAHVDARPLNSAGASGSDFTAAWERPALPSVEAQGTSTTSLTRNIATNTGEQLSLFDADAYTAGGVNRAAQHGGNWSTGDLAESVSRHGGVNPELSYSGQKTILTNGSTGTEVIMDNAGGYYRIRGADGTYRMLDGSTVPANVPILNSGSGSSMAGVPKDIRQGLTHFWIG